MDTTTLAIRINASADEASRRKNLAGICEELTKLLDITPSAPNDVPDDCDMSAMDKKLATLSDTNIIKLALPKMCTHVMTGKKTVDEFATFVAQTYHNLRMLCILHGVDI